MSAAPALQAPGAAGFYHCSVKGVGRAAGRSIVAAAAYRAGERLLDETTGLIQDYQMRGGVLDTFIITQENAAAWSHDRAQLWNGAERAEPRANARLATELELALPHELTAVQRRELVADFVRGIVEQHGIAADVAIHAPGKGGDNRNHHAHVLLTHREVGPDGFGEIANTRTQTRKRKGKDGQHQLVQEKIAGIAATPADITAIRQAWERDVNRAYERAGLDIRVDHRSHEDRGIEEKPTKHLGPTAAEMEKRGAESDRGDANREITQRNADRQKLAALEAEAATLKAQIIDLQAERAKRHGNQTPTAHGPFAELQRAQTTSRFATAATRTADPQPATYDRDAADIAWAKKVAAAGIEKEAARGTKKARQQRPDRAGVSEDRPAARGSYTQLQTPEPTPEVKPEPPLGKVAGEIRMAWSLSRTASDLEDALAVRGISLALVSADDAKSSVRPDNRQGYEPWMKMKGGAVELPNEMRESAERSYERWADRNPELAKKHDFSNYVNYVQTKWESDHRPLKPAYAQGEIVAVDQRGYVHRLTSRTTGDTRDEINSRLGSIDRSAIMNVADTQDAMREASLSAWREARHAEREKGRPPSWIENRIAECAEQARLAGAVIERNAKSEWAIGIEALADRLKLDGQREHQTVTVFGAMAFAARLEDAGIAIVRVTAADGLALDALRQDEQQAQLAAETNRESRKRHQFAAVEVGELAAVTRGGDVHRINPDKLASGARQLPEPLPSVTEARARFEIEREKKPALWAEYRAQNAAKWDAQSEKFANQRTVARVKRGARKTAAAIETAHAKATNIASTAAEAVAAPLEGIGSFLGNLVAPAPALTKDQAEGIERAAAEQADARARAAPQQASDAARGRDIDEGVREQQNRLIEHYGRYGVMRPVEQPQERERDDEGRERER